MRTTGDWVHEFSMSDSFEGDCEVIDRIQTEAWNEAIKAVENTCCVQVDLSDRMFASKESILKLLK